MLRYLPHHDINEKSWDDCIALSEERIVYAYSWYLNVVCKQWDAIVEEQDGKYVSVFPIPLAKRLGRLSVLQPYFTQQLGLFTTTQSTNKSISDYLVLIQGKYKSIYLQLNTANRIEHKGSNFDVKQRINYHLSLTSPYKDILKKYRNRHKLHKAQRNGLQVKQLHSIEPLIHLFRTTKGKELREVKAKHYRMLARLYDELKCRSAAQLLQVVNAADDPVAAALFIHQPGKIIFLFSGANEEGRRTAAMTLLLDSCIQQYAESDSVLDFEGSMVPSVAKFYANFGATPVIYVSLENQYKPWYLKWKEIISIS